MNKDKPIIQRAVDLALADVHGGRIEEQSPTRLRLAGESVGAYRLAMGWPLTADQSAQVAAELKDERERAGRPARQAVADSGRRYAILNDTSAAIEPLVYLHDMNTRLDVVGLTPDQARDVGHGLVEGARRADPAGELRVRELNGLVLAELEFAHRIIGALVASHLTVAQIDAAEAILMADPRAHDVGDGLSRYHERGDMIRKAGGNAELFRQAGEAVSRASQRQGMAERALAHAPTGAKWLFIAKGDAGDPASLTWCKDDAAVTDAVGAAMFCTSGGYDWRNDADHADQVKGTAESLIEDGFVDFEGDPGLELIRLARD